MRLKIQHKLEAVPMMRGRPLLVVSCTTCNEVTVARSPEAETVLGWRVLRYTPHTLARLMDDLPALLSRS